MKEVKTMGQELKQAEGFLEQVPDEHRKRGAAAGTGAVVGGVIGSVVGGPIGAAIGASIGGAVGVAVNEKVAGGED